MYAKGGVRLCKTCKTDRNRANAEKRKRMTSASMTLN